MCDLECLPLLQDAKTYVPDTLDLNKDTQAAEYWFPLMRNMAIKSSQQAIESQNDDPTAKDRAEDFRLAFCIELNSFETKRPLYAEQNKILGIRNLLDLNEILLRRYLFPDCWRKQKEVENKSSITLLQKRCEEIDKIENDDERWIELIRGVLAGNMFDWGAQASSILINDANFGLHAALDRIEKRPWLIDDLDGWLLRLQELDAHKCAAIFVDNSGVDIVLGILPFARELLKRGTKVLLCANTKPSLNDVTCVELRNIIEKCCCYCDVIKAAWSEKRLQVHGNGQSGPCLDMRKIPSDLCQTILFNQTDLLIIEGMGRALHTNLYAKFNCDTLKLAVIKNKWLAERLGGSTFSVLCKFEKK